MTKSGTTTDELEAEQASQAYAARIEAVIAYVERNLDGDLSLDKLSSVALFSPFHFHRQFSKYTGMTVAQLVRLLRLQRAALRIALNPSMSILRIALESGFENPESFSRAFKRQHGQSPSAFRRSPSWTKSPVKAVIKQYQESKVNTEVEIVTFPDTNVAAVEYQGPEERAHEATMKLIAWRRENGVRYDQGKTFGVHYSDPRITPPDEYRLDVCVSFDGEIAPNAHGVISKRIPGGRCARIRHFGSRDYIAEADYIYREWLPKSGQELRAFPIFFHYVNVGPDVRDADMITDVYLPLH